MAAQPLGTHDPSGTIVLPDESAATIERRLAALEAECHRLQTALADSEARHRQAESRAWHAQAASEARFRLAMQNAPIGMALVGLDGTFLDTNPALQHILRYSAQELQRLTFQDITHPDDLGEDLELLRDLLAGRVANYRLDKRYIRKDGTSVWVELQVSLVRDGQGRPEHFVSQIIDITERREEQDSLRFAADHDPLTGLHNRTVLLRTLSQALERPAPDLAVLYCDLDRFKDLNDSLGHGGGDEVLREVADRIRTTVRTADTVSRLGGDEFVIVLPGVTDADAARAVAGKIRAAVARPLQVGDTDVHPTLSVGVAIAHAGLDADALLRHADEALYGAKRTGRDRVVIAGA